ncbi:MAG: hypothetical protein QM533_03145 [Cytophagales bacterium]|nr:hypothetical protein [Cytophagales bacterium]
MRMSVANGKNQMYEKLTAMMALGQGDMGLIFHKQDIGINFGNS